MKKNLLLFGLLCAASIVSASEPNDPTDQPILTHPKRQERKEELKEKFKLNEEELRNSPPNTLKAVLNAACKNERRTVKKKKQK